MERATARRVAALLLTYVLRYARHTCFHYMNKNYDDNKAPTDEYILDDDDTDIPEYVIRENQENTDEYSVEEKEEYEAPAWKGQHTDTKTSGFGLMIHILSNPADGWKALKRAKLGVESIASSCFYPLIALASVSEYSALFYDPDSTVTSLLEPAIITLITFFFGYFSVLILGNLLLPKESHITLHNYYGKEFVMINISTLTLFYIIFRIFPPAAPIWAFLPFWTIYLIYKGVKLFRVPKDKESKTFVILSILIIGSPIFWNWIFTELLNL